MVHTWNTSHKIMRTFLLRFVFSNSFWLYAGVMINMEMRIFWLFHLPAIDPLLRSQVRYGSIHRKLPRTFYNGTRSASDWPSPRQTPGPPCPFPSDRTPPYATMKLVDAPLTWSSPSDLDNKESDGRDPPQGVAPYAHRGAVGAPEMCK